MSSAATERWPAGTRGAARRDALLDATVRVIGRGGIAAVDHRAVAAEAGVPLGSTTYYFASKEEMVAQALAHVAETEAERVRALTARRETGERSDGPPAQRLADELLEIWAGDPVALMAQFELYLESGRRPELRDSAAAWDEAYRELLEAELIQLGTSDAPRRARLLCAALDGLLVEHLATGSPRSELRALIAETIERLAAG
jgi:DNA-binding transcriptional regulator YbjK